MTFRAARRWTLYFALFLAGFAVIAFGLFETGVIERWVRNQVVQQLELRTGARVELGAFHLQFLHLRARAENLTLHGLEDSSKPPLFHADRVEVGARKSMAAVLEGDMLRTQLAVLRRFMKREPVDTLAMRQRVSTAVQANDRYPFEGR